MTLRRIAAGTIAAALLIPGTTGLAARPDDRLTSNVDVRTSTSALEPLVIDRGQSRVSFLVTKWGFLEVEGRFQDFGGTIVYDPQRPEASRIDWRVKVASVKTDERNRDESLQQPEYFDTVRYPELTFVSDRVMAVSPAELEVQGRITIKGRTRPLTVRVRHATQNDARTPQPVERFETEFTINRYDFGIVGGSVLGPVISREARVRILIVGRMP
jgi:polyisoprenoid-binding protein YceI